MCCKINMRGVRNKGTREGKTTPGVPYLDIAGLLHKPAGVLGSSVAFRELDSEELESPFKVGLQEVLFRRLERDMRRRWEERGDRQKDMRRLDMQSTQWPPRVCSPQSLAVVRCLHPGRDKYNQLRFITSALRKLANS